jgi:hypothetical protein
MYLMHMATMGVSLQDACGWIWNCGYKMDV